MASTAKHYNAHSAETYEEAYFYEPGAYMHYLVELVTQRMQLDNVNNSGKPRHILDIGGGTGNFASALIHNCPSSNFRVTVVEPFLEESKGADMAKSDRMSFVKAPAEIFLSHSHDNGDWRKQGSHQVLIKETIHHIDEKVRVGVLKGLYDDLKAFPCGNDITIPSILIITRPQVEIDYPLWDEARRVWKESQPSLEQLQQELQLAGFVDIQCTMERYHSQISLQRWQEMIKKRFWSTFANFSDEELEFGCEELARERPPDENGVIHFEDRLLFITGRKVDT
ncbi:hypothetical protein HJC23_008736 [Cyclotella cryptica]|uniref:Methyltransferase domain-containing protein n=1 Tax=Cyclotella cryptica TaxID=29204 RepID=A0ABD3PDA5_9STRA|eukprot:CCRYP_015824-RA/>CCRYP_015824-RA protein AED:0.41 eAED:0.41 QI:0/-1/0/1/-1/1/1/0/281